MLQVQKKTIFNSILVFLLFCYSGNPAFGLNTLASKATFSFLTLFLFLFNRRRIYSIYRNHFRNHLILIILIIVAQMFVFKNIAYGGISFILKLLFGLSILIHLKEDYKDYFFKFIYVISLFNFMFYLLELVHIKIPPLIIHEITYGDDIEYLYNYIIHTAKISEARFSGMFWEPGAFACYIILVLLINVDRTKKLLINHPFKLITICSALLMTFSTTGYIAFFVLLIFVLHSKLKKNFILYPIIVSTVIFIAVHLWQNFDFLGEKFSIQFEDALKLDGEFINTRLGSLIFDSYYIIKHPFVGNGFESSTRYADHPFLQDLALGHGNGFSNFLAQLGILPFCYIVYLLFLNKTRKWMLLLIFLILLQGEQLLNFPLFIIFPYYFIWAHKNLTLKENCS